MIQMINKIKKKRKIKIKNPALIEFLNWLRNKNKRFLN